MSEVTMQERPEKLLEVSIVAQRLSVSSKTVLRMIHDQDNPLRGVRLNRKCIRVVESSISLIIKQREIT
jgi:predicted DNA-binding transcriptional regulator AlpA